MDIQSFSEKLQQQVQSQSDSLQAQTPIIKASRMMSIIQDAIGDLQQFIHNYEFSDLKEEIKFFKEIKPVLLSQYYFYRSQLNMATSDNFKEDQEKKQYYQNELRKLERFIKRNQEFYLYCITNQTYLDEQYFTRKTIHFTVGQDLKFTTHYDDKLAQLLSHELTRADINDRIIRLARRSNQSSVTWTGNKTDVVELIAALHATGNFNKGEAELKQVISSFEECFNVSLENYYDLFKKIRLRSGSRSNFIDKLKERLNRKINQMEE